MKNKKLSLISLLLTAVMLLSVLASCGVPEETTTAQPAEPTLGETTAQKTEETTAAADDTTSGDEDDSS